MLTDVVEGAAGGWRDLQEARVDERSEGGGGLVFLHAVAGLALRRHGARLEGREGERSQIVQTLGRTTRVKTGRQTVTTLIMHVQWAHRGRNNEQY